MPPKVELNRKFGTYKSKLTNIAKFLEKYDKNRPQLLEVKSRLEDLNKTYSDFDRIINTYCEILSDEEYDEISPSFEEFTDSYHMLSAKLNTLLIPDSVHESNSTQSSSSFRKHDKSLVKLPDIPIPVFSGIGTEWLTFKQTFSTLIHENSEINNIVKFTFLIDKLSGEAKQTLGHITLTAEGYTRAWETLLKRYDNPRIIMSSHIEGLCNLAPISKEIGKSLRSLLNKCNSHVSSIEACGEDLDSLSQLFIVHLVVKKLDNNTRREWEEKIALEDNVTWNLLFDFLQNKCRIFEAMESLKSSNASAPNVKHIPNKTFVTSSNNLGHSKPRCSLCKQDKHLLFACEEFQRLSPENRYQKIKELKLCINCFSNSHSVANCNSRNCKKCDKKHHTMLDRINVPNKSPNEIDNNSSSRNVSTNIPNDQVALPCNNNFDKQIVLATSMVRIHDNKGKLYDCRALLDSGSQSNFISQNLVNHLKLKCTSAQGISISGINEKYTSISSQLRLTIHSKTSKYKKQLEFLVLPVITKTLPQNNFDISLWDVPANIKLSDPCFNLSRPVDLLLGAEIYFEVLLPDQITISNRLPILQNSHLGWLVSGKIEQPQLNSQCFMVQNTSKNENLDCLVKRFWEMESFPSRKFLSKEEELCENHFEKHTTRHKSGRYIVTLPHNDKIAQIGRSKEQALKRFHYLENKLINNSDLKMQYSAFLQEYIDLEHMKKIDKDYESQEIIYYLPHHAVLRPDKSTTKLRVVFDASAKTTSNISLNDTLLVGPNVQQFLFDIILRFRKHKFVFSSDISKMYRQVLVQQNQTNLQRILWRFDKDHPISEYNLMTVTYGTSCAPYLATRCLKQLALDEGDNFPKASKVLINDFYVDDVLTGADTIHEALYIRDDLIQILKKGGFSLHKWCANNEKLLTGIHTSELEILQPNGQSSIETIKTLGLSWQPNQDQFVFDIKTFPLRNDYTKRSVLSDIASVFDPLGLISPIVVYAKIFLQTLSRSYEWDDPLNENECSIWNNFRESIGVVKRLSIPRCVLSENYDSVELHGFSDASEKAFCACIYIRALRNGQPVSVVLLCSKTRVAPLKVVSLPRLELSAALLLAQLTKTVIQAMEITFTKIVLWTDSTITLFWINTPPFKLKTFVANRVNEIQELSDNVVWCHVKSQNNPADIGSRGIVFTDPNQLGEWWDGPKFLYSNIPCPNSQQIELDSCEEQAHAAESKRDTVVMLAQPHEPPFELWNKYSRFKTLQRVLAFVLRFIANCRNKIKANRVVSSVLSTSELDSSLFTLIRLAQNVEFHADFLALLREKSVDNKSKLKQLNPFLDEHNLIRVGGRLNKTNFAPDVKNQIILPAQHILTKLIFNQYHDDHLHPGQNLLLSFVRQKFWPINGKSTARQICRNCVVCIKAKPILSQQIMGDIPPERVTPNRPFNVSGVDLCGPFMIRQKFQRRDSPTKVYVAAFVCFVSKALHLEIVSNLSAESFISCLKRFVYRRGKPSIIWSDNATNFTGTENYLNKQFQIYLNQSEFDVVNKFCADQQIMWKFIPPRSPHFGGLWESSIKSFKGHFKRITGTTQFTYEEFNTLVIHIEGILNSRPITTLSNDPSDPMPLTPGHFTTGGPIISIVEPSVLEFPSTTLSNWENVYCIAQRFWKRFSLEYIHNLQQRTKWKTTSSNLKVGDIVLVVDKNLHTTNWLYGKIEDVKRGNDNNIRVVSIKTKNGIIDRAITNICKLPIDA